MGDSTTQADIPGGLHLAAGYTDLWSPDDFTAARARFPRVVRIARSAAIDDGDVLDVETGDATPAQAPGWVQMRRAADAGRQKTIYCAEQSWSLVIQAFAAAGVAGPEYWVARYDNDPGIPAGAVAKQYANAAITGGHYDLSSVQDHWPGVDQEGDMNTTDQAVLAYATAYGPEYSITPEDIQNGVQNLGAGMTWTQLYQALLSNPPAVAYRERLAAAIGVHSHPVTVTISGAASGVTGSPQ